jgi:outer membrane protein OmpA-like peptidoglycan-associated protein
VAARADRLRILERRALFVQMALSAALAGCAERTPATSATGPSPGGTAGTSPVTAPPPSAGDPAPAVESSAPAPASAAPTVVLTACLTMIVQQVRFAPGKADLDPAAFPLLDEITAVLTRRPDIRAAVEGHRDKSELEATLDERRADAVRRYFVAHGVAGDRMCTRGFDAERPMAPPDPPKGRAANRRVELRVLEPDETCDLPKP